MTTNVPNITFGPAGVLVPTDQEILDGVIQDFQAAFGSSINLSSSVPSTLATPQGQLASSMAALTAQADATFQYESTQTDPAYAIGRWQDAIARIYFLERLPSQPTVVQCVCTGLNGVIIPVNSLAEDESGNLYISTAAGTIASGSVSIQFANLAPGPIACPEGTLTTIKQAVFGWNTITNPSDGVLGNVVESPAAFEARRQATVAGNSFGAIGSILGAVAVVPNVLDFYGYDNGEPNSVTQAGVSIAKNSIFVCVAGGLAESVAQAIWSKKAPGCGYTGNTTETVYDSNPLLSQPIPYSVTFEIPTALPVVFAVNIAGNSQVPSNAAQLIQQAIINAFSGEDGGSRARIGTTIYASRYYAAVASLGSWAQIISIQMGSANTSSSIFTGSIAGNTLTVSATSSGTVASGQTLIDSSGDLTPGTVITGGSGTTFTVNNNQTVASETMTGIVANQNSVVINGNQIPTINAANIAITVT